MAPTPTLDQALEAILFCSPEPVSAADLLTSLKATAPDLAPAHETALGHALDDLGARLRQGPGAVELVALAGGFQLRTKTLLRPLIEGHLAQLGRKRLTPSTLETLAIIAYRQPVTKAEIEAIRGISSDYTLLRLLERGLIEIAGRRESPGRPVLYRTTTRFLEHLSIESLSDLPPLRDPSELLALGNDEAGTSPLSDLLQGRAAEPPGEPAADPGADPTPDQATDQATPPTRPAF